MPRTFLITGCSTGFGAELVKVVLAAGDIAIATSRKSGPLDFTKDGATDRNFLKLDMDVNSRESVERAFEKVLAVFGRVDVVVNNAGFGLLGEFESLSDAQMRQQMDVTRKAMEIMRGQKSGGVIQQVTSIGGQLGLPVLSIYSASKWAVEGFTESVSKEVKPEWNIRFTCIEPSSFRTDYWAGPSLVFGTKLNPDPYDHLTPGDLREKHGKQKGDPVKAVRAMYDLAGLPNPPLRIVLGSEAYEAMLKKVGSYTEQIEANREISCGCDCDDTMGEVVLAKL
ncbi:hypothetical protein RQP46_007100 [Phenoliferia psychrophenolica]